MAPLYPLLPLFYTIPTLLRAYPVVPHASSPTPLPYSLLLLLLLLPYLPLLLCYPPLYSLPPLICALFTALLSLRFAYLSPLPRLHSAFHRLDVTLLYSISLLPYLLSSPLPLRLIAFASLLLAFSLFTHSSLIRLQSRPSSSPASLLATLLPPMQPTPDISRPLPPTPRNASAFTLLSFHWMTDTVSTGRLRSLEDEDVLPLAQRFRTRHTGHETFQPLWKIENERAGGSLLRALFRAFGKRLLLGGLLKAVNDVCIFVSPMLLRLVRVLLSNFRWRQLAGGVLLCCRLVES